MCYRNMVLKASPCISHWFSNQLCPLSGAGAAKTSDIKAEQSRSHYVEKGTILSGFIFCVYNF